MRKKTLLIAWLLLMLLPLGWVRQFSVAYRRAFDAVFAPEWMHILAHLALFAGLAVLLIIVFRMKLNLRTAALIIVASVLVGLLQESFQMFAQGGRPLDGGDSSPAAFDLGIDALGGLLGLAGLQVYNTHGASDCSEHDRPQERD